MKARFLISAILVLALASLFPAVVHADGIIIPDPPVCGVDRCPPPPPCEPPHPCPPPPIPIAQLNIRYHHVTVKIDDQVATTHVDQVFHNPNRWAVEGEYIFPLPLDAAVSSFSLWVDGEPVQGQVLSAEEARAKYEEIVRSQRDPALLEYAGRGAVQAHIFPIPPDGERRIELEYVQALSAENGLVRYTYPLNTEKFSAQPLESVSISIEISSRQAIRAVYSPTHSVDIERPDDTHARAGYEAENVLPDSDFSLYYSMGESEAFHLLTYRDPSDPTDPDGFFLLLLAPKPVVTSHPIPKDLLLVLDHSGSMDGEKFRQAQDAARYILNHLNPEDRFNVITFSTSVDTLSPHLVPAGQASEAVSWVESQSAQGSTDINRALLEAASQVDRERPTYLIFMTDGLPTEGVVDRDQILANLKSQAPANLRLFAFGVGYDVDTVLLDSLAQEHHGLSTYVRPGEALDETLSSFYARISTPVLTNLSLDFGSIPVYDLYPNPLPDLFMGSQIILVGRYRQNGPATVALSGQVDGATQTFRYPGQTFAADTSAQPGSLAALPRLWATRKIGYLLGKIRLNGPDQETIDQIVRLSIRYGIVTPYTSYLVTEPAALGAEAQQRIGNEQFNQLQKLGPAPATGQAAVDNAAGQGGLSQAEVPAGAPQNSASQVRVVGARTFVFTNNTWVDTAFDPQVMPTTRVAFLSDDYFRLAESDPSLAAGLALGDRVILVDGNRVYEVVDAGTVTPPLDLPTPNPSALPTAVPLPTQADPTATPTPVDFQPSPTPGRAPALSLGFTVPYAAGAVILGLVLCAPIILILGRKK